MPRKGKGSKVEGSSQTAYANRTDLNKRGPQPITTAPGQAYGEAEMQRQAQAAVPMGGTPQPPMPSGPSATPAPTPQPATEPGFMNFMAPASGPATNIGEHPVGMEDMANKRVSDFLDRMAASPYATSNIRELALVAKLAGI